MFAIRYSLTTAALIQKMRLVQVGVFWCCVLGCGGDIAPPSLLPQHREAIKESLVKLGAKVTSEIPEAVYLSLRNSHVEIRELAATIESAPRTQRDIQDFAIMTQAVANCFLETQESEDFKKWLRGALARQASPVHHDEYEGFTVTLSRKPLRAIFTLKPPPQPD
jgi:hypothetical protein